MRKTTSTHFFEKYLRDIAKGRGQRPYANPVVPFTRRAKNGDFDKLSDEAYYQKLREVEDLSAFWQNEPDRTAAAVLCTALETIDFQPEALRRIAEILSEGHIAWLKAQQDVQATGLAQDDFAMDAEACDALGHKQRRLPNVENQADADAEAADLSSPQRIYDWLSAQVYGQPQATRAAAMLLYNHARGRKRNLLFIGATGSGKTEIWRVCRQLYPGVRIVDSTAITGEGWSGNFKLKNLFDGMERQQAEHAIIVFDEFDKICEPQISSSGSDKNLIVQNELLKLIEGTTLHTKDAEIDTSGVSFVFCGSFESLTQAKASTESQKAIGFGATLEERAAHLVYQDTLQPADLVRYTGMRQEIAGRINQIVQLVPMTAASYAAILADAQISPLRQLERQYGVRLRLDDGAAQRLVREAETTHMGVRYLRSRIQQMLDEQMFEDCDKQEYLLGA